MEQIIIDAHAHLWEKQDTVVNGKGIRSLNGGRTEFMGETVQMTPPYMTDSASRAELFVSCMDYARVSAAVITQEYIDGNQDEYLLGAKEKFPDRFKICCMPELRDHKRIQNIDRLLRGFDGLKIPAQRLLDLPRRVRLDSPQIMELCAALCEREMFLSIDLADGTAQVDEMEKVITAYPELKIAIGHFAMVTRDGWQEQVKLAGHKNVMIESGGITWLFHKEFYPYEKGVEAILEAADLVGFDKLMWGSDYPRTMTAITYTMSYDFIVKTDKIEEEDKRKFLGENAVAFYGFDRQTLTIPPYIRNMVEDKPEV